jgi:hypothetical protein
LQLVGRRLGGGTLELFARMARIGDYPHPVELWQKLLQQFHAFANQLGRHELDARHVAARPGKTRNQFCRNQVAAKAGDHRNRLGQLCCGANRIALGDNHIWATGDNLRRQLMSFVP